MVKFKIYLKWRNDIGLDEVEKASAQIYCAYSSKKVAVIARRLSIPLAFRVGGVFDPQKTIIEENMSPYNYMMN